MKYKLGIDVGGTNTDAVLLDESREVVASIKCPTSANIYDGILNAVKAVLEESRIDPSDIHQAMLGTTQCTNAIVERKNLAPSAILRIGAPATLGIPPMTDWSEDLKETVKVSSIIGGGFEFDGKELAPLDTDALDSFCNEIKKNNVHSVAVSCTFSTVRDDHEIEVKRLLQEKLGDTVKISISRDIGSMGLIERENATILNAALCEVSRSFTEGFQESLREIGIVNAEIYLSQNDGTLMTVEEARRYPILTIACGPTNSIRGAGYLSDKKNAVVIDVGGTTTDLGVLQNAFPRESGVAATIGGVRTNFRMPDVISIGLGGGSIVREKEDGSVSVGPDSVGYQITEKALCFGGDTCTATDIAVRLGMADLGDPKLVSHLDESFAQRALKTIRELCEDAIDAMKVSSDDVDVILVGGGSIILPEDLAGTREVIKHPFGGVANAIGSAISKVSGTYEGYVDYELTPREDALESAKQEAVNRAISAGAVEGSVEIIDVEDIPLQYYPGNTCRIKVKAAGELL